MVGLRMGGVSADDLENFSPSFESETQTCPSSVRSLFLGRVATCITSSRKSDRLDVIYHESRAASHLGDASLAILVG